MALQPAAATPVGLGIVSMVVGIGRRLAAAARVLWGMTVGLLFLLAFPFAVVLAPLLWAVERLRGGSEEDGQAEGDFL
jgi:hypothetical protein